MKFNLSTFAAVVAAAKAAAANSPAWLRAIDKAAAALLDGSLIVTLCGDKSLVTSANGQYWVNGVCACAAAKHGNATCYHRAAVRLIERYEAAALATKPQPTKPRIVRSVERQYRGDRVTVVYCDGWAI